MFPVNSSSKLQAADFLKNIQSTTCLPDWIKAIFSIKGNDLRIAGTFSFKKSSSMTKPPAWFQIWYDAAFTAWHANEWELTTGALRLLPKDMSIMKPDGISVGEKDPDGNWIPKLELSTHDSGVGGLTVPTERMQRDMNASKDQKLHYNGGLVKPASTGTARGAIIVVDRFETETGAPVTVNANDFTSTLFHELFHAGRISRGEPSADADDSFSKTADLVKTAFSQCP